mmetsp:Transcript_7979/g.20112  ORF Transcript_7979/g.20112 Transcript_7979/m.20112 type:complete len:335 (-) Transcript_7979:27-1031(-)
MDTERDEGERVDLIEEVEEVDDEDYLELDNTHVDLTVAWNENHEEDEELTVEQESLMRLLLTWRTYNNRMLLYHLGLTFLQVFALAFDWQNARLCSQPLRGWLIFETILHSVNSVFLVIFQVHLYRNSLQQIVRERRFRPLSFLYMFTRGINVIIFVFWFFGAKFTFQEDSCIDTASLLYRVCWFTIFIQLAVVVMVVLMVVVLALVLFTLCFGSSYAWPQKFPQRGASKELINSLKLLPFNELMFQKEDAMCAICLSEYEVDQPIRYLPCNHHFHSECVDQWLASNKTCPFCKQEIDAANFIQKDLGSSDGDDIELTPLAPLGGEVSDPALQV